MVLETYLDHAKPPQSFASGAIKEADLFKMLEAARWAPSADNYQVWRFIVVTSPHVKSTIRKAIEGQDPRLTTSRDSTPIPLNAKELDRMRWNFTSSDYDPSADSFRDEVKEAIPADCACAETAGSLIICGFQPQLLVRAFGEVELGAAVLNLYLMAIKLGYRARIIRNFDREIVRNTCKIPEQFQIQIIVAIGVPLPEDSLPAISKNYEETNVKSGISLVDLILDRRAIRNYVDKKIPVEISFKFQHLLEYLPTFTRQKFIDVRLTTDTNSLQKIAQHARIVFFKQKQVGIAPAIATISYKVSGASGFYGKMDVGMIFQAILMESYSLGIGSCWVGAFHHSSVREILQIPGDWRIEGLITLGYPKEYPQPPPRLPIANLAFQDLWDKPLAPNRVSRFAMSGLSSIIRRAYKTTEAKTILRERDAGHPLVAGFKEAFDLRVSRGRMV